MRVGRQDWSATARACLVAGAVSAAGALPAQERERRTVPGDDIAIYNLAGELRAEAGSGTDVVVEIVRGGRDGDRLRVATGRIGARETLRVIYPDDDIVYSDRDNEGSTDLTVRDDGTFGGGDHGGRRVRIRSRGSGLDAYADLRVIIPAGRRVSLYLGVGRASVSNVDGELRVDAAAASVTADGTRGKLIVDTGSGSVRVSDAEGDISIDTGSGSAEVSGVRGGTLNIDTGSGGVLATNVDVSLLNVDVGSGAINVRGARAPDIRLDSGSGTIEVALSGTVRSLKVDSGSGNVSVTIPPSVGAELSVETGSGTIDSNIPITVHRWRRNSLTGRIGDGAGRIEVETGSGSVKLRRG